MLTVIKDSIEHRGYPPSMREIGEAGRPDQLLLRGPPAAGAVEKGYLKRDPHRPRALSVFDPDAALEGTVDETGVGDAMPEANYVQLVGGSRPVGRSWPTRASRRSFPLPAPSSATAPSSCSRWSATRWSTPPSATATTSWCARTGTENGEIVATLLDGEATVKTFQRKDGKVWLLPHNDASPIDGTHATILGKVTAVLRRV